VSSGFPSLSAHVTVDGEADCHRIRLSLADMLEREYGIAHSTLQVEHEPERLLEIRRGSDSEEA
jgi:cobalt-zinc-cadmium efflux system protein